MNYILLFIFTFFLAPCHAGGLPSWVKEKLDPSLKPLSKESDALLVYSHQALSNKENRLAIHHKKIYHLTRSQGTKYGTLVIPMDRKSKAKNFKAWRFNSQGEVLESLKRENIRKRAYNLSFYDDSKQVFIGFDHVAKGDWVAFEYNEYVNSFFNDVVLTLGEAIDVLESKITYSGNVKIKILNDPGNLVVNEPYSLSLTNWKAPLSEYRAPSYVSLVPAVGVSWVEEGHQSWRDFGQNYSKMTRNLSTFSGTRDPKLTEILKLTSKFKLICEVARYVQDGVNYVDIEFGKGGYIPRSCNFVHEKKYGDCKDMAFYAISLLKLSGIEAFPVLARTARSGQVYPEFVGNQFNHAIMAVKLEAGTLALQNSTIDGDPYFLVDLTDNHTPLPLFQKGLEGSYGLLIEQNQSKLFRFPFFPAEANPIHYEFIVHLDADQTLHVAMTEIEEGHFYAYSTAFFESLSQDKKREKIKDYIDKMVPGSRLESFDIKTTQSKIETRYTFAIPHFGIESPDGLLIIPNVLDLKNQRFKKRSRQNNLLLNPLSHQTVNIQFTWHESWQLVAVPQSSKHESSFFSGSFSISSDQKTIQMEKEMIWSTPVISVNEYKQFRKDYRKFRKAFKSPVILKRF